MLQQLSNHTPDEWAAPSPAKVMDAVKTSFPPMDEFDDEGTPMVLFQNASTVWLSACVYLCLSPFLYSIQGNAFSIRQLLSVRIVATLATIVLIRGVVASSARWLPSIPLIISSFSDWYQKILEESPLLTKSVTAGLIQFVGDYGAQHYENSKLSSATSRDTTAEDGNKARISSPPGRYNFRRGLSLFVDGLVLSGPMLHYCYQWMEEILPTGTGGWKATMCHVMVDDYIIDNMYITLSFVFTSISEGHGRELASILRKDYWATMTASWCTNLALVPVEFFCFGCLSVQFRTLFMNFVDLLWGAIISFMSHRSRRRDAVEAVS
jgi:Mpv17 / PMP22 family